MQGHRAGRGETGTQTETGKRREGRVRRAKGILLNRVNQTKGETTTTTGTDDADERGTAMDNDIEERKGRDRRKITTATAHADTT